MNQINENKTFKEICPYWDQMLQEDIWREIQNLSIHDMIGGYFNFKGKKLSGIHLDACPVGEAHGFTQDYYDKNRCDECFRFATTKLDDFLSISGREAFATHYNQKHLEAYKQ
jgi:hypothetical protein